MFRLLAILGVAMFLGLLIGGQDRGQVRQGLVVPPPEPARAAAPARPVTEAPVVLTTYVPVGAPAVAAPAPSRVVAVPAALSPPSAAASEAPAPATPLPVFSLSTLPETDPAAPAPDASLPLRYVLAKSVNVRQGPSTNDAIIGRLTRGEAVSMVGEAGDGWLLVRIEGDGVEGFVAARLLSDAPVN